MSVDSDTSSEPDTHRYLSYTKQRALEAAARHRYEAARQERVKQNEFTAESRKTGLMEIFESVDRSLHLRRCRKSGGRPYAQASPLENTTNASKSLNATRAGEFVAKTEIVPILPCKGYTLPNRNLFIGGKWPALDVNEWRYEVFGLEKLKDETMQKIHKISTLEYEYERPGDKPGEPSDAIGLQDLDAEDFQSQNQQRSFVFTQATHDQYNKIPLNANDNPAGNSNGLGWEDGILWDNGSAYL